MCRSGTGNVGSGGPHPAEVEAALRGDARALLEALLAAAASARAISSGESSRHSPFGMEQAALASRVVEVES